MSNKKMEPSIFLSCIFPSAFRLLHQHLRSAPCSASPPCSWPEAAPCAECFFPNCSCREILSVGTQASRRRASKDKRKQEEKRRRRCGFENGQRAFSFRDILVAQFQKLKHLFVIRAELRVRHAAGRDGGRAVALEFLEPRHAHLLARVEVRVVNGVEETDAV